MREIAARGVGIIYISHRLEEVPRVADRVTVLRDGKVAGIAELGRRSRHWCRCWSAGRWPSSIHAAAANSARPCCGSSTRVSTLGAFPQVGSAPADVTLTVREGEIVGLAGIMGAGRTELLSALYGSAGRWNLERRR